MCIHKKCTVHLKEGLIKNEPEKLILKVLEEIMERNFY